MDAEKCRMFMENPSINPLTGRKIDPNGVLAKKLLKECNSPNNKTTKAQIPAPKSAKSITIEDPLNGRIQTYKNIKKILSHLADCVVEENGTLIMKNKNNETIVKIGDRIGKHGLNGEAFFATIHGEHNICCKLTRQEVDPRYPNKADLSIAVLDELTKTVLKKESPNMHLTYMVKNCNVPVKHTKSRVRTNPYHIIFNDLAKMDLKTWFKQHKKAKQDQIESIITQAILSLSFLHKKGYSHGDAYLENYLVHEIQEGGYWWYKFDDNDMYVPNTGYLVVISDFDLINKLPKEKKLNNDPVKRFPRERDFESILSDVYKALLSSNTKTHVEEMISSINNLRTNTLTNNLSKHESDCKVFGILLEKLKSSFKSIHFDNRLDTVINNQPYIL